MKVMRGRLEKRLKIESAKGGEPKSTFSIILCHRVRAGSGGGASSGFNAWTLLAVLGVGLMQDETVSVLALRCSWRRTRASAAAPGAGALPSFRGETKCWWGRAVPTPVHELALAVASAVYLPVDEAGGMAQIQRESIHALLPLGRRRRCL